jgi:hypothetical protein
MNGLFIHRRREKCTVLCANYLRILIPYLTHADLMTRALKAAPHSDNVQEHRKCLMTYCSRVKAFQFNNDRQYLRVVLKRIIAVIKLLAPKGRLLKGDNQSIDNNNL